MSEIKDTLGRKIMIYFTHLCDNRSHELLKKIYCNTDVQIWQFERNFGINFHARTKIVRGD
jgi:hypothetical protein